MRRIQYLDGWRGISIALVLVAHFTTFGEFSPGRLGVTMFFALSGRLMGEILWEQHFPVGKFLLRRFSRVWPALFVFVMMMLAIMRFPPSRALAALTFTYTYLYPLSAQSVGVLGHLWSLCVEEHTYVVLLVLAVVSRRNIRFGSFGLAAVSVLSIGCGLYRVFVLKEDYYHSYWLTDSAMHFITLPALAYLWRDRIDLGRFTPYAAPIFAAIAIALYYHRVSFWIPSTFAPAFLGISMAKLPASIGLELLEWKPLRKLGLWSYSIYLWQEPFQVLAFHRSAPILALSCAGGAAAGIASFRYIENPARKAINGLSLRYRQAPVF